MKVFFHSVYGLVLAIERRRPIEVKMTQQIQLERLEKDKGGQVSTHVNHVNLEKVSGDDKAEAEFLKDRNGEYVAQLEQDIDSYKERLEPEAEVVKENPDELQCDVITQTKYEDLKSQFSRDANSNSSSPPSAAGKSATIDGKKVTMKYAGSGPSEGQYVGSQGTTTSNTLYYRCTTSDASNEGGGDLMDEDNMVFNNEGENNNPRIIHDEQPIPEGKNYVLKKLPEFDMNRLLKSPRTHYTEIIRGAEGRFPSIGDQLFVHVAKQNMGSNNDKKDIYCPVRPGHMLPHYESDGCYLLHWRGSSPVAPGVVDENEESSGGDAGNKEEAIRAAAKAKDLSKFETEPNKPEFKTHQSQYQTLKDDKEGCIRAGGKDRPVNYKDKDGKQVEGIFKCDKTGVVDGKWWESWRVYDKKNGQRVDAQNPSIYEYTFKGGSGSGAAGKTPSTGDTSGASEAASKPFVVISDGASSSAGIVARQASSPLTQMPTFVPGTVPVYDPFSV